MRSSTLAVLTPVLLLGIATRAGAQQYPPATDSVRASAGAPIVKSVGQPGGESAGGTAGDEPGITRIRSTHL